MLNRLGATENLERALVEAEGHHIESTQGVGPTAPRPYPDLARPGRAWVKAGRYWVTYSLSEPPVILGVFFETADIPGPIVTP